VLKTLIAFAATMKFLDFFITKNTLKFRQASLPVSCSILTAFVVNGLHYSNFLNILLIIEGIIMQPQVVLDLYANEGSNL
jgi:hypothetical protein